MKTTLELPDHLVREIELRAAHEGRVVNDVVAELLAAGLSPAAGGSPLEGRVVSRNLPLIKVRPAQPADAGNRTTQHWCGWHLCAGGRMPDQSRGSCWIVDS
jgi:plasmid stability protein